MVGVPKIYNRIYASINEQFNKLPLYKKFLVNIGLKRKIENLRKYGYRKNQFWDKLVFDQIRKMFGGSLNIVISGAAPLSAQVIEFLSVCLQCKVFQGYGSTGKIIKKYKHQLKTQFSSYVICFSLLHIYLHKQKLMGQFSQTIFVTKMLEMQVDQLLQLNSSLQTYQIWGILPTSQMKTETYYQRERFASEDHKSSVDTIRTEKKLILALTKMDFSILEMWERCS